MEEKTETKEQEPKEETLTPEEFEKVKLNTIADFNARTEMVEAQLQYELKLTELQRTRADRMELKAKELHFLMGIGGVRETADEPTPETGSDGAGGETPSTTETLGEQLPLETPSPEEGKKR